MRTMIAQIYNRRLVRPLSWLACIAMACPAWGQVAISPDCRLEAGPTRAVARVIDGETIRLDDGSEVRLIGALSPRAFDVGANQGSWPPELAAIRTLTDLVQGRSVVLSFGGRRTDRYGRSLAQVMVKGNGGEEWVQGAMLEQGMARAYSLPGDAGCLEALISRERPAREAQRGLWANAAYHVRTAERSDELQAFQNTFQLVRGTIRVVSRTRSHTYLNFGLRDRTTFSAVMKHSAFALPEENLLRGRNVLVRGWIERRAGPVIEIDASAQLEVIGAPAQEFGSDGHEYQEKASGEHAAGRP